MCDNIMAYLESKLNCSSCKMQRYWSISTFKHTWSFMKKISRFGTSASGKHAEVVTWNAWMTQNEHYFQLYWKTMMEEKRSRTSVQSKWIPQQVKYIHWFSLCCPIRHIKTSSLSSQQLQRQHDHNPHLPCYRDFIAWSSFLSRFREPRHLHQGLNHHAPSQYAKTGIVSCSNIITIPLYFTLYHYHL